MSNLNTNYSAPTTNANLQNGVPGAVGITTQTNLAGQQTYQAAPLAQQQQQPQPQQLPATHALQYKQQQTLQNASSVMPPPASQQFNSNFINNQQKYMPAVSSAAVPMQTPAPAPAPLNTNGAMRPPTSVPSSISNMPPHLRPPAMNGPSMLNGANGGGSTATSANSSRTASPGLLTLPQQQQQQQQQQQAPTTRSQTQILPPGSSSQAPTQYAPNITTPRPLPTTSGVLPPSSAQIPPVTYRPDSMKPPASTPSNVSGGAMPNYLIGGVQNLTLNGAPPPTQKEQEQAQQQKLQKAWQHQQQQQLQYGQQQQRRRDGFDANASVHPQNKWQPSGVPPSNVTGSLVTPRMQGGVQPPADSLFKENEPRTPNAANVFGSSSPPTIAAPGAQSADKTYYGSMARSTQQSNQNNNNSRPQTQPLTNMQPTTSNALPTARRAMYPPATASIPSPGVTQNLYGNAYQQPQTSQQMTPGMFNGQSTSTNAPLQYQTQQPAVQFNQAGQHMSNTPQYNPQMSTANQGFSRLWGQDTIDLMQNRHILSPATLTPPKIVLHNQFHESINCSPTIMRCTMAKIPESNSLLQKSRLPLGILIHPFRDINSLPVIQCPNIVRCRLCRTYINPFVYFVDSKMWKCNLCYRVNELPEDFQFDPATKTYGDVTRRPEVRSSTIEFIAPSEYMLRPPQPAIYLFLFDVSIIAQQSGYLETACAVLNKHLDDMPGDARTQVGFIAYDSFVHFYSIAEGFNQPHEMTLLDIDDPFLPRPDSLLVNLKECRELVKDLLAQLPKRFMHTHDPGSALGAALQVGYKLMQASGGRITVFQTCLPNKGPGSLEPREDPNNRSSKDVAHLNPATDFYKRYALECSGYQIAVDLFLMNQQYSDMATISGISKHSGGCVYHFPLFQKTKQQHIDSFKQCFKRYLVRKIGFEAVMRIRCTRGLQVHTFHGNFFVRSTDLLSLPNVNPDAGYGMQISYEESLTDVKTICFQAALLYTNSEGERRIRVHTLCLPVTASLPEVMHAADTEAIIGLLSKMAVDRSIASNVSDAREAFINATVDVFNAFKIAQNLPAGQTGQLIAPRSLALMPLYILALLKHPAFRVGTSTRLDDRVYAMDCMKTLPLDQLMKFIYPEFYNIDILFYNVQNQNQTQEEEEEQLPKVPRLQLSAEYLDSRSIFLMDCGTLIMIYVGLNVPTNILEAVLGMSATSELPDYYYGLPSVNSTENDILRRFILRLNDEKPYAPLVQIIRDTSTAKPQFIEKLVDDRSESSLSYYEFLQHIRTQVK